MLLYDNVASRDSQIMVSELRLGILSDEGCKGNTGKEGKM